MSSRYDSSFLKPWKEPLFLPHVKESKTDLDSGFWILHSGLWTGLYALDSGFQLSDFGFFVSGTWIPDTNR